jgi:precorrin-3B synthase
VLTPWRELLVVDLPQTAVAAASELLGAAGLQFASDSPWRGLSACAGRPACGRALLDVRALAAQIAAGQSRSQSADAGPRRTAVLHLSGCERRCGAPRAGHREIVAGPGGLHERDVPAAGQARR